MSSDRTFIQVVLSVKVLLKCFIACVCLVVVLCIVVWKIENWRGKRAWEQCKQELEAQGEHLDMAYFIPPPVPDDQNFAMCPLFKPLFDYTRDPKTHAAVYRDPNPPVKKIRVDIEDSKIAKPSAPGGWMVGKPKDLQAWQSYYRTSLPDMPLTHSPAEDVLAVLGRFDGMLSQLREAAKTRPLSRFPVRYDEGASTPLPHCEVLQRLTTVLALRASAELGLNRPDDAWNDIEFGFHLFDSIHQEPVLLSNLVRVSLMSALMQPIWEGIATHHWREDQLANLEEKFKHLDFLSDYICAIRAERAFGNAELMQFSNDHELLERYIRSMCKKDVPIHFIKGWFYQNMVLRSWSFQEMILAVDPGNQKVDTPRLSRNYDGIRELSPAPWTVFFKVELLVFEPASIKLFQSQVYANEAVIACEIERYRMAHDTLPATLADLHLADMPHDIINGEPLHYRVTGEDNYLLYSVGWNGVDDGGKIEFKQNGTPDGKKGDWVWTLKPL